MACIRKRRGKWVADYYDRQGKRHWETFNTRKEATAALAERVQQLVKRTYVAPGKEKTFSELCRDYTTAHKPQVKGTTWLVYEGLLRLHLEPYFLGYKLPEIRVTDVEGFVADRIEQEVGAVTINKALTMAVALFKYAEKHEWMHSNPATKVPKLKTGAEDMTTRDEIDRTILSGSEFRRVIENADPEWRLIITMAGLAGLRQGELRGLRWKCVDLDKGETLVRQQFTSGKFSTLKSLTSRRTVPLGKEVVRALREHKMASKWAKADDLVFPSSKGTPCGLKYMAGAWKDAVRKAKLSARPFHSLRHSYASAMLRSGVNVKVASTLMGHASVAFTLDVYSHLLPDDTADVGEKVAAAMLSR